MSDINAYVNEKFSAKQFLKEMACPESEFFEIRSEGKIIAYLKLTYKTKAINFNYISEKPTLINNMDLKNNITIAPGAIHNKTFSNHKFKKFLEQNHPAYILEMYNMISDATLFPSQATIKDIKLAGLLKYLITPKEFLILSSPEKYLDKQAIECLKKYISSAKKDKNSIIIHSEQTEIWSPLITKELTKNEKNKFELQSTLVSFENRKDKILLFENHRQLKIRSLENFKKNMGKHKAS